MTSRLSRDSETYSYAAVDQKRLRSAAIKSTPTRSASEARRLRPCASLCACHLANMKRTRRQAVSAIPGSSGIPCKASKEAAPSSSRARTRSTASKTGTIGTGTGAGPSISTSPMPPVPAPTPDPTPTPAPTPARIEPAPGAMWEPIPQRQSIGAKGTEPYVALFRREILGIWEMVIQYKIPRAP